MFENNGHKYVYTPGAGADNPVGSKKIQKYKSSVNLVICCKFFLFIGLPHYNAIFKTLL